MSEQKDKKQLKVPTEAIENPQEKSKDTSNGDAKERQEKWKANGLEVIIRIKEVELWLIDGYSRGDICKFMLEKHGISDTQTDRYIRKVKDKWEEMNNESREDMLNEAISRRKYIINELMKEKKFGNSVVEVEKDLRRLQGLYVEHTQVDHNFKGETYSQKLLKLKEKFGDKIIGLDEDEETPDLSVAEQSVELEQELAEKRQAEADKLKKKKNRYKGE
jgi:hypothetical protein